MRILISGALGRMGQAVSRLLRESGEKAAAGVDICAPGKQAEYPLFPGFDQVNVPCDCAIDFSRPENLPELLAFCLKRKLPLVLATTGFHEKDRDAIQAAAKSIPIFQSANMSLGVCVLRRLAVQAARILGDAYDVEIVETHHNQKIDAPSGTALMLFDALKDAYPQGREMICGREGRTQPRGRREIGVHALRGGTVAGIHEIHYLGPDETISLTHTAQSRDVFAAGALEAARFLIGKPSGIYDMDDLISSLME